MHNPFFRQDVAIDLEIQRVLGKLGSMGPADEDYKAAVNNLKVLYDARSCKTNSSVDANTVVMAVTNILGILLILNYEQVHVVTTKAVSFVLKGKV